MARAFLAAAAYFAIVFGAGFVLGTLRVFVLVPRLGEFVAVALELPVMLIVSWVVCGFVLRRTRLPPAFAERLTMGLAAFALLMAAEAALAAALGNTISDFVASLGTPHGILGLAGQIAFAAFPLIRLR